jgi:hypothetical protein
MPENKSETIDTLCGTTEKRVMSAETQIPQNIKAQLSTSKSRAQPETSQNKKRDYFKWVTID